MKLLALRELAETETRTPLTPSSAHRLIQLGFDVWAESKLGVRSNFPDAAFESSGVQLIDDRKNHLADADVVLRVNKPPLHEVPWQKRDSLHVSFLDPFHEPRLLGALAESGITTVSMEMMPRSTLAQKMDVLSSQANLAGYYAVIKSAERLHKILPMMMTPAGTIAPSRYFVIGVGVAGLQAIATAKRLGARVEAFDTRPVVEEQVKSLGAKFVKIDLGEIGQTEQGYAKELTPEQVEKQRQGMAKVCAQSDVVITTAKLFGRKAPVIISTEMVAGMSPGSIIVDLAVETGGNVEGSHLGEEVVTDHGVRIIGLPSLETCVPQDASQMYASNLANFIEHFTNQEGRLELDLNNDILKSCVLTHRGHVVHERFRQLESPGT